MAANMLIIHGGAPTAVINASLYGAVTEAMADSRVDRVYGALYGTAGVLKEEFVELSAKPKEELDRLLYTPGSAIGTSRTPLEDADYEKMAEILLKRGIRYALFTGGNGSMDTCRRFQRACAGKDIFVAGIPKTIDNDIAAIDHAPGYGSAVNFIVNCVSEIAQDVRSLPIHVCIIEAMGRDTGWIAAASALARKKSGDAPDLIYFPERPFDEEDFLRRAEALYRQKGGVVVVVSEGLKRADGVPVAPPIFKAGRAVYYSDVSSYLANLIVKRLGIKARSEKPGIWGRASAQTQSALDRAEAVAMGALAARAALGGKTGVMAGLIRESDEPYRCREALLPIDDTVLKERTLPDCFIAANGCDVTDEFIKWCSPLLDVPPKCFADFKPTEG